MSNTMLREAVRLNEYEYVTLSDWNIVLEVSNSSASSLSLLKQVEA